MLCCFPINHFSTLYWSTVRWLNINVVYYLRQIFKSDWPPVQGVSLACGPRYWDRLQHPCDPAEDKQFEEWMEIFKSHCRRLSDACLEGAGPLVEVWCNVVKSQEKAKTRTGCLIDHSPFFVLIHGSF